jgi:hypothetical protein
VDTGRAAVVINESETEKMDKAPVEVLDDEKNMFSTIPREWPVEVWKVETEINKILSELIDNLER